MNFQSVRFEGHAQDIIAIHGFGGFAEDFAPLAEVLPNSMTALQLPFNEGIVDYSTEALVHALELSIKPNAIVLGYSMGARLLLQWGVWTPSQKPKALIVISGSPGIEDEGLRDSRRRHDAEIANRIETEGVDSFFEWWSQVPIIASQQRIPEPHRTQMQQRKRQYSPTTLSASLKGFGQGVMPSCWDSLKRIECPVLLIVGETDLKYRAIAEQMHSQLSQAELAIVPDAGHCPHLEKAENTGTIIQKWFDRHGL